MTSPSRARPLVDDADLSRLIAELNREGGAPAGEGAESGEESDALGTLVDEAVRRGATDLLLVPGNAPVLRRAGALERLDAPPLGAEDVEALFRGTVPAELRRAVREGHPVDLGLTFPRPEGRPLRARLNLHRQRGMVAASLRFLRSRVPTLEELNLPPELAAIVEPVRGLVLVCGPTGSGKTSTLAALIGEVNRRTAGHVITIEDPIEYEHAPDRALIEQIEVGRDAPSFAVALRAALRQDPDVILVGEIRDEETAATALAAAETGHLILASLHTNDAVQSIHRLVDIFPPSQQAQIYQQLSFCLTAVVSQQLVRTAEGLYPAVELMLANDPVRIHIRNGKLQNLYNEMVLGRRAGMVTMEQSLARLVRDGKLPRAEAMRRSAHPAEVESLLRSSTN